MLWLLITVVMVVSVAIACRPFLRRTPLADGASADIYQAQLSELEREEAAGLIAAEDARMARTEIQRRLISATGAAASTGTASMTLTDRTTFIAVAASMAIGSAIIYSMVGSPDIASAPHGFTASQQMEGVVLASGGPQQGGQTSVAPVDEMISGLEARLVSQPDDVEGWRMLGWSKFRTDDFAGAAKAYARAAELAPNDGETLSSYGEALSRAAGGMVTPEATVALRASLKADPKDARARFLLGLKKDQEGKPQEALNDWLAMLKGAEADAPWFEEVRGRVIELSTTSGIDVSSRLPPARSDAASPIVSAAMASPAGPTQAQVSEAAAMAPQARQAMIDGMVARLDARLKANPADLDGWLRLIRARRVLGQTDLAQKALADGKANFAADAAAQQQLQRAMSEPLDLPPT